MRQINIFLKTISFSMVVLLLAQGCIPTVPGGNPTPATNGFNVGLNYYYPLTNTPQYKVIKVDDDSLLFAIFKGGYTYISIGFKSSTGNQYEFYAGTHADSNSLHTLPAGVTVNATPDAGHTWQAFQPQAWFDTPFNSELLLSEETSVDFATVWKDIPNANRYIVFRRLKGSGYQYYWVKVGATFTGVPMFVGLQMTASTHVFNGRYQINSIVTGQ